MNENINSDADPRETRAAFAHEAALRDLQAQNRTTSAEEIAEDAAIEREKSGDINLSTNDVGGDASVSGATLGAVGGALVGAVAGAALGPPGAVAGAVVGALTAAGAAGLATGAVDESELSKEGEAGNGGTGSNPPAAIV